MECPSYYPAGPTGIPPGLAAPAPKYQTQIGLVLVSLVAFFGLYFGILAGCVLFFIWSIGSVLLPLLHVGLTLVVLLQFALCIPLFVLFVYMVKNLFRWGRKEKTDHVEVFADDHPRLFDFIYRVCDETGAPYPKHVFVNYEVNAMAFPEGDAFWHLLIPTDKNLLIGLGLLNAINLTEFQALLAHEFGHFSQKSMKIGAYVYTALGIMNQIVDGRDFIDRIIDEWRTVEGPLAFPAWIVFVILWTLRRILMGLRFVVFFFHSGLSRQMEFNADLVAVSVTGSDAPVHLLFRSNFADRCMTQTIHDMRMAMQHHLYTDDMFHHQSHAAAFVRRRAKKPRLGERPPLPDDPTRTTRVFDPDDDSDDEPATMWSSHPSHRDREENAKAYYIRSVFDERSPWLLFDDDRQLREDATFKFYRVHLKMRKDECLTDRDEIQAFIDEERAETTYDQRYHGLYDHRNLVLDDVLNLYHEGCRFPWSPLQLANTQASLYDAEVEHAAKSHNDRLDEQSLLLPISKGYQRPKNNEFKFRGKFYETDAAKRLLRKVEAELKDDRAWLRELDQRVFLTYIQMAKHLSDATAQELFNRYVFHLALQGIWKELQYQNAYVEVAVAFLQNLNTGKLDSGCFEAVLAIFREAHHALRDALQGAEDMTMPALLNMASGVPLREFLLRKRLIEGVTNYDQWLKPKWINKFLDQFHEVRSKVNRIHAKSLGGILAMQERIAQEWHERRADPEGAPLLPPIV